MSIQSEITRLSGAKSDIADAIEAKGVPVPSSTKLDDYAALVSLIVTEPNLQSKSVTPTESAQTVTADTGYDGLDEVSVGAISSTYVGSGVTRKTATTYTPGTTEQTISANQYLTGAQTIQGDADLIASNIIETANIFGVQGTAPTYVAMTEEEILDAAVLGWGSSKIMTNAQIHTAVDAGWE